MNMEQNRTEIKMPAIIGAAGAELTMSSREIAELCEKRHAHVLRDIEQMLQDIGQPKFGSADFEAEYLDAQGKPRKEYRLPKDLTVTLITGYRADLRYKVVKRLEEMERQQANGGFAIPRSFGEALRLAAEQHEQIEAMRPVVAAMDRLGASEGSVTPRVAAKVLDIQEKKFFQWLHANNWAFRQGNVWQAYAERRKQGYLEHETRTYTVEETGQEKTKVQMLVTPKGMARLAQIFAKQGVAA